MSKKTLILGIRDGIGGSLLAAQCAYFVKQYNEINKNGREVDILFTCRKETYIPLEYLLWDKFNVKNHPEEEKWNSIILEQPELLEKYSDEYDEMYAVFPDGLGRNIGAFNFSKYNTNYKTVKSTRILTHRYRPDGNTITVNLNTTTPGYLYENIRELLFNLANRLTDYIIFCPIMRNWGKETNIQHEDLSGLPSNVHIEDNLDLISVIQVMQSSDYGIYTDSGVSHISFHLGQNRLILDPQYKKEMWDARWKEDVTDSIDIKTSPEDIARLVEANIRVQQTNLLSKEVCLKHLWFNKSPEWNRILGFKF